MYIYIDTHAHTQAKSIYSGLISQVTVVQEILVHVDMLKEKL